MANKITYVKNEEPAFIKAFKQQTGYTEGPTVDSKREELKYEEDDRSDTEEEKPTVVVLKSGDLTAEEAAELLSKSGDEETSSSMYTTDPVSEEVGESKITFKKPVKREGEKSELNVSTSKKAKQCTEETTQKPKLIGKKVKNASLLSFNVDEEDET
ncbi:uncharacterized protein KIAA1143 homolog [Dreissena polymorpha]|uniref:uncharacterized protein KIAA1143 homolog n=1 Tax=Dreissena polymorpha TaxID=45954 RepID=UPI002264711E|nr:uncharacterized protein KIAA1143 homolog [Dreissena polymorpha]XP_052229351.1 uncharacterized protein KIAA1143 homolog [Dreissena polymorpha]XP_052229352.1 uncharacterized protein KIAA1143 homolog [Dreissena polymorpha]